MNPSLHHPIATQIVDTACESIVIHAPVAEVYALASATENLGHCIPSMRACDRLHETSFECAVTVNHREVHSILDVTLCIPEQRIAWLAIGEPDHAGAASFHRLSDSANRLTVKILTNCEVHDLPAVVRRCLVGFKRFAEAGHTCRSIEEHADKAAYGATARKLTGLFVRNFETYAAGASAAVKAAAPTGTI